MVMRPKKPKGSKPKARVPHTRVKHQPRVKLVRRKLSVGDEVAVNALIARVYQKAAEEMRRLEGTAVHTAAEELVHLEGIAKRFNR